MADAALSGRSVRRFRQVLGRAAGAGGFNTVRIDAFPLVIGALGSEKETVTMPGKPLVNWGQSDRDHEHVPVRELVQFISAAKRRGLSAILSSWGADCKEYPGRTSALAKDCAGFRKCWERTLDILGSRDLLGHVLFVDLDQEFPYFSPFRGELDALARKRSAARSAEAAMEDVNPSDAGLTRMAWNPPQLDYVRKLFWEMLPSFQSRYPRLRFTYSLTGFFKEVRSLGLQLFDVLELHLWIHSPRFENRTGFRAGQRPGQPRLQGLCRPAGRHAGYRRADAGQGNGEPPGLCPGLVRGGRLAGSDHRGLGAVVATWIIPISIGAGSATGANSA